MIGGNHNPVYEYKMPDPTLLGEDIAANLAFFLIENTGSATGCVLSRMYARDQRALFGRFLGKGTIKIGGDPELVEHHITVCFGLLPDCTHSFSWTKLMELK